MVPSPSRPWRASTSSDHGRLFAAHAVHVCCQVFDMAPVPGFLLWLGLLATSSLRASPNRARLVIPFGALLLLLRFPQADPP
jgi:hypothetical protein